MKAKRKQEGQEQEQSRTFVEAVRLVSTVPASIATTKTLLTTHATVRRHLPLGHVYVFDQSPTAVCATRHEFSYNVTKCAFFIKRCNRSLLAAMINYSSYGVCCVRRE